MKNLLQCIETDSLEEARALLSSDKTLANTLISVVNPIVGKEIKLPP